MYWTTHTTNAAGRAPTGTVPAAEPAPGPDKNGKGRWVRMSVIDDGPGLPREALSFAYEAVTWTWPDGRTSATDDWLTPA